jgi:hypothetical protein
MAKLPTFRHATDEQDHGAVHRNRNTPSKGAVEEKDRFPTARLDLSAARF